MGLPSVIISFKDTGITAIKRGERGIVTLVLKDNVEALESHVVITVADIPEELNDENKEQVELALLGYQTPPKKVVLVVIPEEAANYNDAMNYLETIRWDYLAIPGIQTVDVTKVASWVKSLNQYCQIVNLTMKVSLTLQAIIL